MPRCGELSKDKKSITTGAGIPSGRKRQGLYPVDAMIFSKRIFCSFWLILFLSSHSLAIDSKTEKPAGTLRTIATTYRKSADEAMLQWYSHIQNAPKSACLSDLVAYPESDSLKPAEVESLDCFKASPNYFLYRSLANQIISNGQIIKEFYLSFSSQGGRPSGITDGKNTYSFMFGHTDFSTVSSLLPIPIEIREIIQYRLQLEKTAVENCATPEDYLKKAKILFHVNDQNKNALKHDLEEFDWFGFSPENIVILVQPTVSVYRIENGEIFVDETVQRLGGHGTALSQIVHPSLGEAVSCNSDGTTRQLTTSVLSYFQKRGAEYLLSAAVNDLTQLTKDSLEPDGLALALYLMDQGKNFILETVENPERRVGGYWVKNKKNESFVVHSQELLCAAPGMKRPLERLVDEGALYSRFVYYCKLETLDKVLSRNMLPFFVEQDNSDKTYCLLTHANDICRLPGINAAAFHQTGRTTELFRYEEDLPKAMAYFANQDKGPEFRSLAKKLYLIRANKHIQEPLEFHTNFVSSPWGGSRIAELKNSRPGLSEKKIGESWEVSAQKKAPSFLMIDGQIQPLTFDDLMNDDPIAEKIVGTRVFSVAKNWFPLLYKFLDANELLSVQVHPSTEVAEDLGEGEPGKSETWIILGAKPHACVYVGLNENVSSQEFEEAVQNKKDLVPYLKKYEVKAGDVVKNEPGVIHAIGAGVFAAEIQENSDITYRLFDHNRVPARPLHIPQALRAFDAVLCRNFRARLDPETEVITQNNSIIELFNKNPYYELRRASIGFFDTITVDSGGDFQIVSIVKGRVQLMFNSMQRLLHQGQTILLPASQQSIVLSTKDKEAQVLLIKPGSCPLAVTKTDNANFSKLVNPKNVKGPVHIAVSVGGTKLAMGSVCSEGLIEVSPRIEWKKILENRNQYSSEAFVQLVAEEIEKLVFSLDKEDIHRSRLEKIGIAWPGPGDYAKGIVSATFIPGFDKYPFGEKLQQELERRLGIRPNIQIVLDAWADAFGEMAVNSTLENWMYLNVATGVAAGIVKDGKIIDEYSWPDGTYVASCLGQLGRHLIRTSQGTWEYRPTPHGEIPSMSSGEQRLTEYVGGQALAKRFLEMVEKKSLTNSFVFKEFFSVDISQLKEAVAKREASSIQFVLETVQKQAENNNEFAIEMISEIGKDLGLALRAFANAFPNESFCKHIIVGGGVGENLGKNVLPMKSNSDILLYNMIQSSQIAKIFRTHMDVKRELLAFRPFGFNTKTKLLVFDLDNTLYLSPRLNKLFKTAIYELYRSNHDVSEEKAQQIVEAARKALAAEKKPSGDRNVIEALGYSFADMMKMQQQIIGDQSQYVEPVRGLRERLLKLKKHYCLVLATNNIRSCTSSILKKLCLEDLFDQVYAQDETGFHKPDTRLFEHIQREQQTPFELMVSIGDSLMADIEPAQKLNMQVLHVKNPTDLIAKIDMSLLGGLSSEDHTSDRAA